MALTGPRSVAIYRLHPCSHWPLFAIAPIFRSTAHLEEQRSSEYFLNLNEKYKKQKVISDIICEGVRYRGQEKVAAGIYSSMPRAGLKPGSLAATQLEIERRLKPLSHHGRYGIPS